MAFDEEIKALQRSLAQVDLLNEPRSSRSTGFIGFLVLKLQNLKVKMYQEKGHSTPHVHIDYGSQNHAASYAIGGGQRLVGNLPRRYDREIGSWLNENCDALLALWSAAQEGTDLQPLIMEIQGGSKSA